jgi:L,D-peptidoglycan transpeptidase YkuD (ErfK/YbiS/YcfS/YnhG family)
MVVMAVGCESPSPDFLAPPACRQLIVVRSTGTIPNVAVSAYDRHGDTWRLIMGPWPGTVGRNGIADLGKKKEGDGCTPPGVFPIRLAFGYEPTINTKLVYRQATDQDYWIDDPQSPNYNQWTEGEKPICSHEVLRRQDDAYRLAAVIEYNTNPVLPGRGSAIFLHIWSGPGRPTAGCVALSAEHIEQLLAWLDRNKNPMIKIR